MALVSVQNEFFRTTSSPLRVCSGPLPQRVVLGQEVVFHLGGCAFSVQTFSIAFVLLIHPKSSKVDCSSGGRVKNASTPDASISMYARLAQPAAYLLDQKCSIKAYSSGLVANCTLLPGNALACMRRRRTTFELKLGAPGLTTSVAAIEITLSATSSLTYRGNNNTIPRSTRTLLWAGAPLFSNDNQVIRWDRFASWSGNWSRAGFLTIHILGHSEADCQSAIRLPNVGCEVRPALSTVSEASGGRLCFHRLYNMLGLYYAQAAEYAIVAFIELEEWPLALSTSQASISFSAVFKGLRERKDPFALAYIRSEACDHCPASHSSLVAAVRANLCNNNSIFWHSRVIGIPSRLHSVDVHSSVDICNVQHPPHFCEQFVACVQRSSLPIADDAKV